MAKRSFLTKDSALKRPGSPSPILVLFSLLLIVLMILLSGCNDPDFVSNNQHLVNDYAPNNPLNIKNQTNPPILNHRPNNSGGKGGNNSFNGNSLNVIDDHQEMGVSGTAANQRMVSFLQGKNRFYRINSQNEYVLGNEKVPFTLGKRLGKIIPYLTGDELMSLNGVPAGYESPIPFTAEQFLRFDFDENTTGELILDKDPETKTIMPAIFFRADKPIYEYAYLLMRGAFPSMIGERIGVFGDDYVVAESENHSITLYGADTEQYLSLNDGDRLKVNGRIVPYTMVEVDPWHFAVRVYAPDDDELWNGTNGLLLFPGESLRDKLPKEYLLNKNWNLFFKGFTSEDLLNNKTVQPESIVDHGDISPKLTNLLNNELNNKSLYSLSIRTSSNGKLFLQFTNRLGTRESISLFRIVKGSDLAGRFDEYEEYYEDHSSDDFLSRMIYLKDANLIHYRECGSSHDYCILRGDLFITTTRNGITRIFEYRGASPFGKQLYFKELGTGEDHVVKTSITHRINGDIDADDDGVNEMIALERKGAFILDDDIFVYAYYNDSSGKTRISVDQNSNGLVSGALVPIMVLGEHKVIINDSVDDYEKGFFNGTILFVTKNITDIVERTTPYYDRSFIDDDFSSRDELIVVRPFMSVGGDILNFFNDDLPLLSLSFPGTYYEEDDDSYSFTGISKSGNLLIVDKGMIINDQQNIITDDLLIKYPPKISEAVIVIKG